MCFCTGVAGTHCASCKGKFNFQCNNVREYTGMVLPGNVQDAKFGVTLTAHSMGAGGPSSLSICTQHPSFRQWSYSQRTTSPCPPSQLQAWRIPPSVSRKKRPREDNCGRNTGWKHWNCVSFPCPPTTTCCWSLFGEQHNSVDRGLILRNKLKVLLWSSKISKTPQERKGEVLAWVRSWEFCSSAAAISFHLCNKHKP